MLVQRVMAVMAAYYVAARLGLVLCDPVSKITLFWPATGIAVAALYGWGWKCWPGVYIAVVFAEISVGHSWSVASTIAVTNTLGPLFGAWLLQRVGFHSRFQMRRDALLLLAASACAMTITSVGGTLNLCLSGKIPWSASGSAVLGWWLGDTVGVMIMAPVLLTFPRSHTEAPFQNHIEFTVLIITILVGAHFVFMQGVGIAVLTTPLVVWGA